ncbi:APC family permease [Neomoorella thermoacetica]|uniref:Amino acid/polyamine/organocation transporter, APC superfamily n=1 Tax=Moorella thermoacetica (strain ATCC 39073 / JCM 9320) TaxID=264732 RepID=Q2RIT1_MOOTA|nr:amino acid permease [Moorella thermoacetica]AKX94123.1 putative amino acid permease YhdG [Moorella thermoacetica]AKX96762.1 putative amino acid permease YhdG [Moorella thermoacetica]APC08515.1 putative amino acid permease YhdG [Moorella thermoacetica]OIQ13027.1 putative amino acid permease YhdG [Moorella thermoacetica]OIQ56491.1 putative amino acid permease YhdG [Moorella thermoacetica]
MATATEKLELRREVTVWGSYMWGYADVGADIYAALGLVMLWAKGATSLAFALAGLVYIMIGLAYTELAAAYPVAGGGQFFTLRGLGDFWGFVAGAALLLDYTIDIALFATASAGYINFFLPYLFGVNIDSLAVSIGPLHHVNLVWMAEALALVFFLIALNIRGMRESSLLNEVLGAIDILTESTIIVFGFLFAWRPELLAHQWVTQFPTFKEFAYGSSLAIISFVGLESISQAAQETKRPATVVPRTSVGLIFTVFIFATAFSTMSLGVLPWQDIAKAVGDPVATLAHAIPFIGIIAGPFAALLGATILLISANSGVMSASRLTFAMSQFNFISDWFNAVHPRYRTPYRTILVFSGIGILQLVLSFLTPNAMDTLGNMYAFGATTGYILVFIALIKLRFTDPYAPRPYKVPLNIKINYRGRVVEFPILGVIGTLGISTILFEVILTHAIGRIAGPAWIILCFLYYAYYRRSKGYPIFGNIPRDWEAQQIKVLEAAEEYDLLEEYKQALAERERLEAKAHVK